jgi:hypothetical protein
MDKLAKRKSESNLSTVEQKTSSLDLVLGHCLAGVMLLYKTEPLPGEVRLWLRAMEGERSEMVEWAFAEYFKTGTFPPKPADILKLIRQKRESMQVVGTHRATSEEDWKRAKEDRDGFFASDKYKEFLKKIKAEHGM